jgi:ABC-type glycerol-3-phosphate transport system substrate-binding protein
MAKKLFAVIAASAATMLALTSCSTGGDGQSQDPDEIAGDITVLTNRTDIVDTVFQDYKAEFEAAYPDVTVNFETVTDYEGEVVTRMNTDDYGDVLLIPLAITQDQLPTYFEPLGTVEELQETYRFVAEQSYEGEAYGLATFGQATGIVYNKAVFEAAGITETPTTPEEFIDALEAIDDETDAIPLYTNYKDGWPLGSSWEGLIGVPSANADAAIHLSEIDDPWSEGEDHSVTDGLLYDAVAAGLTEPDPLTTSWEESKTMLGLGEIGVMVLGSWAVSQVQVAAEEAGGDPADIGYLPFPSQVDGEFHSIVSGNYKNGINVNSDNKAAARAWVDWFANESGYAEREGAIPVVVGAPLPEGLAELDELGVQYIELAPVPDGLLTTIANTAEIDLRGNLYRQKLIDIARGAAEGDKESYFAQLNEKWAAARASVDG